MSNTRIIMCALAAAGVLFIGSQAIPQGNRPVTDVSVTNTPLSVTVTNPTVPPSTVNVGNPAALAAANAQALGVGTPFVVAVANNAPVSLPVGQRFVIEYASGVCEPGSDGRIFVFTNVVGVPHRFNLPIFPVAEVQFGQSVKIYADAGSTISEVGSGCVFILSGQLVKS
jgi:hypothetical protein